MVTVFDILKTRGKSFDPKTDKLFGQDVSRAQPKGNIFDAIKQQREQNIAGKPTITEPTNKITVSGFRSNENEIISAPIGIGRSASGIQEVKKDTNQIVQKSLTRPFSSFLNLENKVPETKFVKNLDTGLNEQFPLVRPKQRFGIESFVNDVSKFVGGLFG